MEWNDIHLFMRVARHGSIAAAARALHVSPTTVARRLRVLENDVGQALLQRHTTGVALTDAGGTALHAIEEMEALALAMQRKIAGEGDRIEGTLRIAAFDWFATYLLSPVLQELSLLYPRIVPQVITGHRSFSLSRREADIAFQAGPFDEHDVMQRRLTRVTYDLYAGAGVEDPIRGDGSGSALLLMDTSHYPYPDAPWIRERLPHARVAFCSNSRELQARLCARGLGLATLPTRMGEQMPELRRIDLGGESLHCDFWVGYHRDLRRMKPLRSLLDIALRLLGEPGKVYGWAGSG